VLPEMDTGDVVIFSGTRFLRWMQASHWSHVGMVYNKIEPDGSSQKFLFEANYGSGFDGSCLVPLRHKIVDYKHGRTDVAYRRLPAGVLNAELRAKFKSAVETTFKDVSFDHSLARGANAIFDCCPCCEHSDETLRGHDGKIHAMFCSELIASVYQDVGLLPGPLNEGQKEGPPASEYVPRDFAEDPGCNVERSMLQHVGLGSLVWIARRDLSWCAQEEWCNCAEDWPCCVCEDSRCCHLCCPCAYYKEYCIKPQPDDPGPAVAPDPTTPPAQK
jgi:hypothetical protein